MTQLPGPIAYLTAQYPRATDTFIQREVAMLRELGAEVLTNSIRTTDASHHITETQKAEAAATFKVLATAKSPLNLLRAHASCLFKHPRAWARAVKLACQSAPPGMKAALWQVFYFLEAGVLAHHLRDKGVRHLHNHFSDASCSVAMLAAELAEIPFSVAVHGPGELFEPKYWRLDKKVEKAAFVTAISYFARSQVMLFSEPEHWDKIAIVHCGVDPKLYDTPKIKTDRTNLLFVGRLAPEKGVRVLIEALEASVKGYPNLQLTLVGDGPDRTELESMVREMGLSDHVIFTGYLAPQDVAGQLATADIFVLPSFAEGVPVSLMEAMASRVPVIAPRVAGVQELVEDGVSGFCVAPGHVEMLRDSIELLAKDADLRATLGQAGRDKVLAEFVIKNEGAWLMEWMTCSLKQALPGGLHPRPQSSPNFRPEVRREE